MKTKKENMLSAIRLWAIAQGMEEIIDDESYCYHTDLCFKTGDKIYGFITGFDCDKDQLSVKAISAGEICNYVYIVADDAKKGEDVKNSDMTFCGILCYCNPSGLGYEYRILRKPQLILH